ncbi:MAG TPA: hypothetical protein ENI44_04755, partial [Thermoplasmatales archaeon]|nr:hypothetical protein [Thermoplasmatales archaeon]
KTIGSPLIPVEYGNWYRWGFKIKGENTYEAHVKIVEYNESRNIITAKQVKSIGSGNFNWKTITIDYTPESPGTKYIQLQIWHGHETTQPLPNKIWIDDIKVYNMKRFIEPVSLEIPFKIDKTNEYTFFTRYFQNQKGGEIKIQLDDKFYEINTENQLNKFVWKEIDKIHLREGEHRIILTNVKGFNAVNLFTLIPTQELLETQNKVEQLLVNKAIIYILEGKSNIYRENVGIDKDINASNGEKLVFLPSGKAWQTLKVIKEGFYRFALKLEGDFDIKIDNQTFHISSNNLNFTYLPPIYLKKGIHRIELEPKSIVQSWNFNREDDISEWREYTPERQKPYLYKIFYDKGEKALRVELYNSTRGWKTINSPFIPVKYGDKYNFNFSVKAVNGQSVHFKIMEYTSSKQYITGTYAGGIGSGTFDWKTINYEYEPKNTSTAYLQLQIWHGHETKQPLPNIIWIKNVTIKESKPSYLDVIWIYSVNSSKSNYTVEDLFKVNESPANITSYEKINPTLWKVEINNATKPFMLSFAESYDPLWEARVYRNDNNNNDGSGISSNSKGKLVEKVKSIPLYGVINGFWINETGNLSIEIRYTPQDWFEIGLVISGLTFIGCIGYLVYDWKGKKIKWFFRKQWVKIKYREYYKPPPKR